MKLLKLGTIVLGGTRFMANASRHEALSYGHAKKREAQFRAEVKALTERAESADRDAAGDGMDIPAEIARRAASPGGDSRRVEVRRREDTSPGPA